MADSVIHDKTLNKNVGITIFNQNNIQEIYERSGSLADSCEFQVYYQALVYRSYMEDGSFIDAAYPLFYYNYPQEVSGAHIDSCDYSISNKIYEELREKFKDIKDKCIETIKELLIFSDNVKVFTFGNHTIHKHPGGRTQSFSGTDLKTTPIDNAGVVFPLLSVSEKDTPNFASICCVVGGKCYLAHSEYRVVNSDKEIDAANIYYEKSLCCSYVQEFNNISEAMRLVGCVSNNVDYCVGNIQLGVENKFESFYADTSEVKPEHLTAKIYSYKEPVFDAFGVEKPKLISKQNNKYENSFFEAYGDGFQMYYGFDSDIYDYIDDLCPDITEEVRRYLVKAGFTNVKIPKIFEESRRLYPEYRNKSNRDILLDITLKIFTDNYDHYLLVKEDYRLMTIDQIDDTDVALMDTQTLTEIKIAVDKLLKNPPKTYENELMYLSLLLKDNIDREITAALKSYKTRDDHNPYLSGYMGEYE